MTREATRHTASTPAPGDGSRLEARYDEGAVEDPSIRSQGEPHGAGLEPVLDEESRTREALLFMLEDLEENRRAIEQAHREWMTSVDAVRDPIMVHDGDFRILRANRAYAQRAGLDIRDITGKPYWKFFPKGPGPLAGCGREAAGAEPKAHHEPVADEITLDSGETFVSRAFAARDQAGRFLYALHIFEDITERKRLRDALERSERHYRKLIEGGADVFFIIDRTGTIDYRSASGRGLTGWDDEDVLGHDVTAFVPPDYVPVVRNAMAETLRNPVGVTRVELRLLCKDGSLVDAEVLARNLLDDPDVGGIVITARDVTARKRSEQALQRVNRALKTLSKCNEALVHATDEALLLGDMCRIAVETGGYRMAWVGFAEDGVEKAVRPLAHFGFEEGYLERAGITWADTARGNGPSGAAIREGKPQFISDTATDPRFAPWREDAIRREYGSTIALPLLSGEKAFGAFTLYARECNAFDTKEIALLEELAIDLAFGIATLRMRTAHEKSVEQLQQSMAATVQAIAATVEMRDAYTAGHQRRVAELAGAIAREMGLPNDKIEGLQFAAVIHDLGKINIPAEILSKPAKLSTIEYQLIKGHAQSGYEILKGIEFPWPIAQIVLQHHERLDGSGYPQGLKGEDILPEARILMIADVVEAMASHRPYRPGLGVDAALDEIVKIRGRCCDPAAVDACVRLFREKRFSFST